MLAGSESVDLVFLALLNFGIQAPTANFAYFYVLYVTLLQMTVAEYLQTQIFRHPFFRKQCFTLKYVLVAPLKVFGGMSKFGIYVIMKSSLQF